jgi:membrane associated rhomboid family serine protease
MPTPTVGASGMVFFLLGMLIILNPTLQQLKNYIYVVLAVIVSIIFGNSNVSLHALSFVFGALYTITLIAYDNRRIKDSE